MLTSRLRDVSQATFAAPTLQQRMVKLHYNWKYVFLRPTVEEIFERYKQKFGGSACASASSSVVTAPAVAPVATPAVAP